MEAIIEVARRGQITIPRNMCEALNIKEGQKYGVRTLEGGILVLTPQHGRAMTTLSQLRNALIDKGVSLDAMLAELRRKREIDAYMPTVV